MAPYNIIGTQVWGDGNYILPALAIALGGDLFYSVRVLYALIGAATIPVLFFLARNVRGHEAAISAGVLFALNPYRLVNSLEERHLRGALHVPRVPGTLAGSTTESPGSLVEALLAGLCFTAAASFRYEAGFWAMLAGLLILSPLESTLRPRLEWHRMKSAVVFSWPLPPTRSFSPSRWWRLHGDPLYFFSATAVNQAQFFVDGRNVNWPSSIYIPFSASFWFLSVVAVLTPFVAAAAFLGTVRALRIASAGTFALAILAWLSLLTVVSVTRHFQLEYRYALPAYGLACMFVPDGIAWLGSRFAMLARPRVQLIFTALSLIMFYAAYSLAAFHDRGVLGRRLGMLSPVRPGQYETRTFITWFEQTMTDKTLLMSPCVASPYLLLGRRDSVNTAGCAHSGYTRVMWSFTTDAATRLRLRTRLPNATSWCSSDLVGGSAWQMVASMTRFSRKEDQPMDSRLSEDATRARLRIARSVRRGSRRRRASVDVRGPSRTPPELITPPVSPPSPRTGRVARCRGA